MVDRFLNYIEFGKRYSLNTVNAYRRDLLQFETYLHDSYDSLLLNELSSEIIRSWVIHLMDSGYSAVSVNRKLSSLKAFYRFLLREGFVHVNPVKGIVAPKKPERLPVFISEENMSVLLDNYRSDNFIDLRDQLIMELFYQTGIRVSELVHLKDSSFQRERAMVKVLGKRNKERMIPVGEELLQLVQEYILLRDKTFENKTEAFIVTNRGNKAYPKFVYNVVETYLSRVATVRKKSPHVLRHTFATHMMNSGADINFVKELLGHSSLASTEVYTHNTISKLKLIYKQAHPRA